MMKRRLVLMSIVPLLVGLFLCSCKKGTGGTTVRLVVSIPPVTTEQIERDVMDQEESKQSVANWKNYVDKVVTWSGIVMEPGQYEKIHAERDFSFSGRTLVVVQVKNLRVQIPAEKAFTPGTNVTFTATLNGFVGGSSRQIFVARDGLSIEPSGK
jgi:hypothetical protein